MKAAFAYDEDLLSSMRLVADPIADSFIQRSFSDEQSKFELYRLLGTLKNNSDLTKLRLHYQSELLFQTAGVLPSWADEKRLQRAAQFFCKYANQIMQLLGVLSLPYCYAAANGAMVLYLSERLKNDTEKRLFDTGKFVWEVQSENAFSSEGKGLAALMKTRLIHAIARHYTLLSGRWNFDWGDPVNQEDLAGTNLAFSLIIVRGLRKTGVTISTEEQNAFLHLWAVISFLLGVDERLIPENGKEANWQEQIIRKTQFTASLQGKQLTESLITTLAKSNPGTATLEIKQLLRFLLEEEIAEILGLGSVKVPLHLPALTRLFFAVNRFFENNSGFHSSGNRFTKNSI